MWNNLYILLFIVLLTSCVDNTLDAIIDKENVVETEGKEIVYDFSIIIPEHQMISTRSGKDITDLYLLVFDENGRFLSRTKAIMEGTQIMGDGVEIRNFKAVLLSSNQKRYIHFVANYDGWDNFPPTHEILNMDEGSIVPRMNGVTTTYWGRFEFDKLELSSFGNRRFPLLRNKAKIEVENQANNFIISSFAIYNAPKEGTVAPFQYNESNNSFTYTEGALTPVNPVDLVIPQFVNFNSTSSIELFEKNNQLTESKVFIVIKAKLNGGADTYFKLDIMKDKANGILYDVFRNRIYRFIIKSVVSKGYATAEEAAINPAANNIFGSVELRDYPSISDGISYLRIERSAEVFIQPGVFETQIDYFRDLKKTATSPVAVEVNLLSPDPNGDLSFNYNLATGKLTVSIIRVPDDRIITHTLKLATKASEGNGIFRYVTLVLRSPYNFNFKVVNIGNKNQNSAVQISFDVPGTIPSNVFPISMFFQTKELYPDPTFKEMDVNILNKVYRYEYKIKESDGGKRITLHFKRTYSSKTENIPIISQYLVPGTTVNLN